MFSSFESHSSEPDITSKLTLIMAAFVGTDVTARQLEISDFDDVLR